MIKSVIFDWGDVLHIIDQNSFLKEISNNYSVDINKLIEVELQEKKKLDAGEIDTDQYINNINNKLGIKINKTDYFDLLFSKYVKLNKQLISYIKKLKKNYNLIILSNNNEPFYNYMKKATDFESIFDKIIVSFKEKIKKPNKLFFEKALIGLKPEECVYVDNKEDFAKAAENLGMKIIVYTNYEDFMKDIKKLISPNL